jgi:hypothetical protein
MRCKARVAAAHQIVRAPRDRVLWFSLAQQIANAVVREWHEDRCDTQYTVLEHWLGLKSHCLGVRPHVQNDRAGQRCHHRNRGARPCGARTALSQLVARNRPQV